MNIITALGNQNINKKIKEKTTHNIEFEDIQYKEGILELLEKNNKIDLVIINELLPGEIDIEELINKIHSIKEEIEIIIFLENKNKILENNLNKKNVFNIFYNNEITIKKLIEIINKIDTEKIKINKEIEIIKNIILKNEKSNKKYLYNLKKQIKNKIVKKINKNNKNKLNYSKKIINIIGNRKSGKTIISILLGFNIKDKKILIIDFNLLKNNIYTILQIKNNKKIKINKLEDLIIKKDKNIDLLLGTEKVQINKIDIKKEISFIKRNYDYIIIDNNMENNVNILKSIFEISTTNILIVEPNISELKETQEILELCVNKLNLKKEKIKIIFNKINKNSINKKILSKLFYDFKVLGEIKYNKNYNLFFNSNLKIIDKKTKKEYKKIIKNIGGESG